MNLFKNLLGIIGSTFSLNKGSKSIVELTVDPTVGGGVVAPVGSVGLRDNSGEGEYWLKISSSNTGWTKLISQTLFSSIVFETTFPCDRSGSEYNYRTRAVSSSGSFEFGFNIPKEADVIEEVYLQGITTAVPGTPGDSVELDFTIDTNYSKYGEAPDVHGESAVTLPVALIANAGSHDRTIFINVYKADVGLTLFANAAKEDMCGMNVKNPSSTSIEWTGVIVRWRKTSF